MTSSSFSSIFDDVIAKATEAAATGQNGLATGTGEPVSAEGSSADERIKVTMVNGEVTAFEVQPHALRVDNVTLGEHLAEAVNNAIKAYQAAMLEAIQQQNPDLERINSQLRETQLETQRQISRYAEGMAEMLRKAKPE